MLLKNIAARRGDAHHVSVAAMRARSTSMKPASAQHERR
jgi:hypothetical protein